MRKNKNANASLFLFFFSFLGSVLYVYIYIFFLSKRPKNVTLCYMNVCVLIYLWFAKLKIWSMLQVLSQENEKKKKTLLRMIPMCLCDGGRCVYLGGFQEVKKDRRLQSLKIIKGVFPSLGVHQSGIKKVPTLPWILPSPLHDVTTLPSPLVLLFTVIRFLGIAVNTKIWTESPPSHRSRLSMTSLCFKSHS